MRVVVNGKEVEVRAGMTVRELIESQGLGRQACAAEVNKVLVPWREQDARVLCEGDSVELVSCGATWQPSR